LTRIQVAVKKHQGVSDPLPLSNGNDARPKPRRERRRVTNVYVLKGDRGEGEEKGGFWNAGTGKEKV